MGAVADLTGATEATVSVLLVDDGVAGLQLERLDRGLAPRRELPLGPVDGVLGPGKARIKLPAPQGAELTQMDYEFYPQALENVIRKVAQDFHGDLIVTENGIATADDTRRVAFIEAALAGVQHCIADGIPVK